MQSRVHHKALSHVHYHLDSTLGPSTLMLCSDTREGLRLPFINALLAIFLSGENPIIAVVVFDLGIQSHCLKQALPIMVSFAHSET
jgi:hypothetical protein